MRISTVPAFGAIVEHISDDEVCVTLSFGWLSGSLLENYFCVFLDVGENPYSVPVLS